MKLKLKPNYVKFDSEGYQQLVSEIERLEEENSENERLHENLLLFFDKLKKEGVFFDKEVLDPEKKLMVHVDAIEKRIIIKSI